MKERGDLRKQNVIAAHSTTSAQEPAFIESDKTHHGNEDIVTIAGQDSFPASDSPAWTLGREPRTD